MARQLGARASYLKCEELSESKQVLFLHSAKNRPARGKFQEQIAFLVTLDSPTGQTGKLTLTRNEERDELAAELNSDDEEIGPVVVVKVQKSDATAADVKAGRDFYWAFEPANVEEEKAEETPGEEKPKGRGSRK